MRKADLEALAEDGAKGTKYRIETCPFCGAAPGGAVPVQITTGTRPDFAVRCQNCDATGPWALTPKIATELWNFGFQSTRPADGRRTRNESRPKKQKANPNP